MASKKKVIKGFKINTSTKRIIISQSIARNSNKINSEEYKLLSQLIKDYPTFEITVSKTKKHSKYLGLKIDFMRKYINLYGNKEMLNDFNKQITLHADHPKYYFTIRKWFLKHCQGENVEIALEKYKKENEITGDENEEYEE